MAEHEPYYYNNEFQDLILAALCKLPSEFAVVHNLIQPEYFWGLHATIVAEQIKDFHADYGNFPNFVELEQFVVDRFPPDEQDKAKEVIDYAEKLRKLKVRNVAYVKDRIVHFCRERALISCIRDSMDAIKAGKWPEEGFSPMFDKAMRVGQNLEDLGLSLADDYEAVVDELTSSFFGVRSGFPLLDSNWHNGWGPGWLVVPLAPPKSYKSTFCANLAMNMTEGVCGNEPVDVLYYACEISAQLTLARTYCSITGLPMDQMYKTPNKFLNALEDQLNHRWGKRKGAMLVKGFASKEATIGDIRMHALQAIEAYGIKPKAIFIDHAETVRVSKRAERASDWRQQADIYAEARALGGELGATVIMPDRCNRETVDKPVPSMKSFQGSFEKAGVVDVGIGLCQTDEERAEGERKSVLPIRYFVFLNRHGEPCGYYHGQVTKKTMKMTLDKTMSYETALQNYEEAQENRKWGKNKRKDKPPDEKMLREDD